MGLPDGCEIKLRQKFPKGEKNKITDVPGIKVGHTTLIDSEKDIHTGVTAILPHSGNLFREKLAAGSCVINGFGKSAGLIQVNELGTIESPIILTNTLSVGEALTASVKYMLRDNPEIGTASGTVNCLVAECSDARLNDIRGLHVTQDNVLQAIESASEDFEEGAVGAGAGMCCMGLKGGIGSASRVLSFDGKDYILGALILSNFGIAGNLRLNGELLDTRGKGDAQAEDLEKGSAIVVIGTDLPLSDRQLRRVSRRVTVGMCRTGSFIGNGSGDIGIAFSTSNIIPHFSSKAIIDTKMMWDDALDSVFEATAEAVEECVISSLYYGETVKGIRNTVIHGLREYL